MKNLMQKIQDTQKAINPRFSMDTKQFEEIRNNSKDMFRFGTNCFIFGYMQGVKAAKAEIQKSTKKEKRP